VKALTLSKIKINLLASESSAHSPAN